MDKNNTVVNDKYKHERGNTEMESLWARLTRILIDQEETFGSIL